MTVVQNVATDNNSEVYLELPNQLLSRDFLLALSLSNNFSTCSAPSLRSSSAMTSLSLRNLTLGAESVLLIG